MTRTVSIKEMPASGDEPIALEIALIESGKTILHRRLRLDAIPSARDLADVRWYLEEFPNHPFDPAPALAAAIHRRMAEIGSALFTSLSAAVSDARFDQALRTGLDDTSFEIRGASGRVPWELMRDPENGRLASVDAQRMVRVVPGAAREAAKVNRDARLLLVVSRPSGAHDVGYQSVARPLISTLAMQEAFEVTVLRPPTHDALRTVLNTARDEGRPFELVHFDGHGLMERGSGRLVFEGGRRGDPPELVTGGALGADLAAAGVRIAVLNACRSADVAPPGDPNALPSLAEELVLAGLSATVAMQYDVRVDTAARFVVPLYAGLAAGRSVGESVTDARRGLFRGMQAARERGVVPTIDDWFVPTVYEAEQLTTSKPAAPAAVAPRAEPFEAAAFYGRDDILLQIDRAFGDTPSIVVTGMGGSGKTATARQFARWYAATGGVTGGVVLVEIADEVGQPYERVLAALGGSVEAALARPPGLLLVDGVNAPPLEERDLLNQLFERLAAAGSRMLLTANGAFWVAAAEEVRLGPLTAGDMVDILADHLLEPVDEATLAAWRPVLDLANGNPLALETLVGWAGDGPARNALNALVDDVLGGEGPELPEPARQGLGRLAGYFLGPDDWQRLLVLLHRQRYADINQLLVLGKPDTPERLEELADVSGEQWAGLFVRLSVAGLAWQAHDTYFEIHPLFSSVLSDAVGDARDPARLERIERMFVFLMHSIGTSISKEHREGDNYERNLMWAQSEEHNMLHAHTRALRREWWDLAIGPLHGLHVGYLARGRRREWSELVRRTAEHAVAPNGDSLPGREALWAQVIAWLQDIAKSDRNFGEARTRGEQLVTYWRSRDVPQNLALALLNLAMAVRELGDPACLMLLEEAKGLLDDTDDSDRPLLAGIHYHLGMSYQELPGSARDLAHAFEEYGASLELQHEKDDVRRAKCISQQGEVALRSALEDAQSTRAAPLMAAAWQLSTQALSLFPATASDDHAVVLERLGRIERLRANFDAALRHDMAARAYHERTGDVMGQARGRYNVALDLQGLGRIEDARVYATAAEAVFGSLGEPGQAGYRSARRLRDELSVSA